MATRKDARADELERTRSEDDRPQEEQPARESPAEAGESSAADPFEPAESFDAILDTVSKQGLSPRDDAEQDDPRAQLERAVRVPLEVYVRVEKGEKVARALTRDISVSGVYLAALTLPIARSGDQVMVEIGLPGSSETVWATARVARSPSDSPFPALGLAFENLAETDRRAIEEYVAGRAHYVDET